MTDIKTTIVVAASRNGIIGRDGDMPWRLSTDLKRFKAVTMGKPIIMGRKTFEAIGRPLPGRLNIVVTRDEGLAAEGVEMAHSLEAAIERARGRALHSGADEICIIGGGEIYRQALPWPTGCMSRMCGPTSIGDAHFPAIDPADLGRRR